MNCKTAEYIAQPEQENTALHALVKSQSRQIDETLDELFKSRAAHIALKAVVKDAVALLERSEHCDARHIATMLRVMNCQNQCNNSRLIETLEADNIYLWKKVGTLKDENRALREMLADRDVRLQNQAGQISEERKLSAARRADIAAVKAVVAEAALLLRQDPFAAGSVGEAVAMLHKAQTYGKETP